MSDLEYATVYFSNGQEFTKDITNVEPIVTLDNKALVVSIIAELSNTASAVSITITEERWRNLVKEVGEMIEDMKGTAQAESKKKE